MNTRREFIRNVFGMSGMLLGGAFLVTGCGGGKKPAKEDAAKKQPASCSDLSGVSEEEKEKRQKLGYVEETPIADSKCGNCKLYLPPGENESCGSCSLFKGPVEENGYCTYYAPLS
ncbi:high-potential iron-sulfur protein [Chitinophaga sp. GCM10012297]|uniref:High-potential iron-sulfur protein n=1 Tax=Chitinophaga chungangae TaxID=2821488 RepID=A0ABS3YJ82_9BACT|nr:high-potential iron-sulfur protein [Chitinophaga chungangae]MBO9154495.1 high-potential iron-sulfur protein [Chitinophaga chungangae]